MPTLFRGDTDKMRNFRINGKQLEADIASFKYNRIPELLDGYEFVKAAYSLFSMFQGDMYIGSKKQAKHLLTLRVGRYLLTKTFNRVWDDIIGSGLIDSTEQYAMVDFAIGHKTKIKQQRVYIKIYDDDTADPVLRKIAAGYTNIQQETDRFPTEQDIELLNKMIKEKGRIPHLVKTNDELKYYSQKRVLGAISELKAVNLELEEKTKQLYDNLAHSYSSQYDDISSEFYFSIHELFTAIQQQLCDDIQSINATLQTLNLGGRILGTFPVDRVVLEYDQGYWDSISLFHGQACFKLWPYWVILFEEDHSLVSLAVEYDCNNFIFLTLSFSVPELIKSYRKTLEHIREKYSNLISQAMNSSAMSRRMMHDNNYEPGHYTNRVRVIEKGTAIPLNYRR